MYVQNIPEIYANKAGNVLYLADLGCQYGG